MKFDLICLLLFSAAWGATVLVLDSQLELYNEFVRLWRIWPSLEPRRARAIPLEVRGHGQCHSLLAALRADERAAPQNNSFIFEPDALPFPKVKYARLDAMQFHTHDVYFLGGHEIRCTPRCALTIPWTRVSAVFGTYGVVLSAHGRRKVLPKLTAYCEGERPHYAADVFLSACFDAVVATPLLVDHPREGYSNTWRINKTWAWAGERAWWQVQKKIDAPINLRVDECV